MNSERIKEIQKTTAYPESRSVHQALLQVWNECSQVDSDPITKDGLIELGFEEYAPCFRFGVLEVYFYNNGYHVLLCDVLVPSCTTIQDVKDLIRLFNIEK